MRQSLMQLPMYAATLVCLAMAACGGGSGTNVGPVVATPSTPGVRKTILDAELVYPYGFTLFRDADDTEHIFLGNTAGGVISSPGGLGGQWPCSSGVIDPQYGEVYHYTMGATVTKQYVHTFSGFVERSAYAKRPDGGTEVYFVENRDGHLIHLTTTPQGATVTDFDVQSTDGARAYDVKAAPLAGSAIDVVYSTYSTGELRLVRGDTGQTTVLTDHLGEDRAVELQRIGNDAYPSIITAAVGAPEAVNPDSGWVSILRNRGAYQFDEMRFPIRGAAYARLAALDELHPERLWLLVSHGLRTEIQAAAQHGISLYRFEPETGTLTFDSEIPMPNAYRFDLKDLNADGVQDIVVGGHQGSGKVVVMLSSGREPLSFVAHVIDTGLVAVNDVKIGMGSADTATVYAVADNGNGCPRQTGGSRLVRYDISLPASATSLQALTGS